MQKILYGALALAIQIGLATAANDAVEQNPPNADAHITGARS